MLKYSIETEAGVFTVGSLDEVNELLLEFGGGNVTMKEDRPIIDASIATEEIPDIIDDTWGNIPLPRRVVKINKDPLPLFQLKVKLSRLFGKKYESNLSKFIPCTPEETIKNNHFNRVMDALHAFKLPHTQKNWNDMKLEVEIMVENGRLNQLYEYILPEQI